MTDFDREVESMRRMAEFLQKYQKTPEDKADVAILATRELTFRGYDITFYLSKEKYPDCDIWTIQIYSKYQAFLPFSLVCDCAIRFLGYHDLGLTEVMVLGRKLYVWSVAVDKDGTPIPVPQRPEVEVRSYDGLIFSKAPSKQVTLSPS